MSGQSILRMREILRELSISRSTFYVLVKSGKFPQPINLSGRAVGWLSTDVDDFIKARIKASRPDSKGATA